MTSENPALAGGVSFVRLDLEGDERFQRLRSELDVRTHGLNLLRLRPGEGGRIHRHVAQEEVYVVLRGTLTLVFEDGAQELSAFEAARVAPDVRRQLVNRGEELCVLLATGGSREHDGRDGVAFASWEDTDGRPPQDVPLPPDER
jgi:uncharacterized cupin superfamily protein